ncbi:MAG: hypothetical protein ACFCU5_10230 [Pleurocapsa sp.]
MNRQFFANNTNKVILAFLAISTIGLTTSPVKADDALIQESLQESVTTGSNNLSVQSSTQQSRQERDYRGGYGYGKDSGNTGIVQRSQQLCDQYGEYNTCIQDAQQSNVSQTRQRRSHYRY